MLMSAPAAACEDTHLHSEARKLIATLMESLQNVAADMTRGGKGGCRDAGCCMQVMHLGIASVSYPKTLGMEGALDSELLVFWGLQAQACEFCSYD